MESLVYNDFTPPRGNIMFNNENFDKQFNHTNKMIGIFGKMIGIFAGVTAVLGIALTAGIVWVAWHFISKFW